MPRLKDECVLVVQGVAAEEIQEECNIVISEDELVDLTELAYGSTYRGMIPSAGGCDEFIRLFCFRRSVEPAVLQKLQGRLTGLLAEGEHIKLQILELAEMWKATPDAKALSALALFECLRKQGTLPVDAQRASEGKEDMGVAELASAEDVGAKHIPRSDSHDSVNSLDGELAGLSSVSEVDEFARTSSVGGDSGGPKRDGEVPRRKLSVEDLTVSGGSSLSPQSKALGGARIMHSVDVEQVTEHVMGDAQQMDSPGPVDSPGPRAASAPPTGGTGSPPTGGAGSDGRPSSRASAGSTNSDAGSHGSHSGSHSGSRGSQHSGSSPPQGSNSRSTSRTTGSRGSARTLGLSTRRFGRVSEQNSSTATDVLHKLLSEQDSEIASLKEKVMCCGAKDAEIASLKQQVAELQAQLKPAPTSV